MKGLAFQEKTTGNIVERSLVFQAVWMKTFPLHPFLCNRRDKKVTVIMCFPHEFTKVPAVKLFSQTRIIHEYTLGLVLVSSLVSCCVFFPLSTTPPSVLPLPPY